MKSTIICILTLVTSVVTTTPLMAAAPNTSGMIYGEVILRGGNTYKGVIRWGNEEFFWGDLFNSNKVVRPHSSHAKPNKRERDFEVFGYKFSVQSQNKSRQFIVRYGDIDRIEVIGREGAEVFLKSGSSVEVDGGSNDVGNSITIHDQTVGSIEVKWNDIEVIRFYNTPATATYDAGRLFGRVVTTDRTFEGFVQWDKEECITTDLLNGYSDDGKLNIPMGNIKRIERVNRRSCEVTMMDGHSFRLSGTNDVNSENRGIMIETADYGRVVVGWDEFRDVTFESTRRTGPEYSSFRQQRRLKGTVVGRDGSRAEGFIAYDLDEEETWEMLNGNLNDVEYIIPMGLVQSVEPRGSYAKVTLRNGDILELEGTADVNERNAGVLVMKGEKETYFEWSQIERIDFDI